MQKKKKKNIENESNRLLWLRSIFAYEYEHIILGENNRLLVSALWNKVVYWENNVGQLCKVFSLHNQVIFWLEFP